jgi:DNA polymerase I-like protein with 3'-5' exonuclease and polymerase domains
MSVSVKDRGARTDHPGPCYLTTVKEIEELVRVVQSVGSFAFDVETLGVLTNHADLLELLDQQVEEHIATLKTIVSGTNDRVRENKAAAITKDLALDPMRNEVIWMGIATHGHSWAIPMGHPNGEIIEEEEVGDGSTTPPTGLRNILKSGRESMAKAKYVKHAVFGPPPTQLSKHKVFEALRPIFFDSSITKVGHNVKFDARSIYKYYGEMPVGPFRDTMIAQHILDDNHKGYSLVNLIRTHFDGYNPYDREGKIGAIIAFSPFSVSCRYVHLDARWTWLLYNKLMSQLPEFVSVLEQDSEVLEVLMNMEHEGITVDRDGMVALGKELDSRLLELKVNMNALTYPGFNPDSVVDKRRFLYSKKSEGGLELTPIKQTLKGQPSVDQETLRKMEKKNKAIPLFLEWSECKKTKSTYVEGMLPKINNGRVHPSFHLNRTATGRLSSSNPNLQNIPREASVRGLFCAQEDSTLLVADYDQVELRVMAMFSKDANMLDIFLNEKDIHSGAAALVFNKPIEEVTSEERQIGKATNFLTAYGGGAGKLADSAGITVAHARNVINQYYEQFSTLSKWKNSVVRQAQRDGFVTTISGRKRRLPDINSADNADRSRAERQSVNAVVQGSASDICKKAMIKSFKELNGSGAKLLVQVHDELVVNVPNHLDMEEVTGVLMEAMGHGVVIKGVPLVVSYSTARTWSEAK